MLWSHPFHDENGLFCLDMPESSGVEDIWWMRGMWGSCQSRAEKVTVRKFYGIFDLDYGEYIVRIANFENSMNSLSVLLYYQWYFAEVWSFQTSFHLYRVTLNLRTLRDTTFSRSFLQARYLPSSRAQNPAQTPPARVLFAGTGSRVHTWVRRNPE